MAGLIDANLIRPELAGSFTAGYRGAEQARQQTQQNQQQFEMNQMKLEQLKQDRAALTDLQSKLRARGQSDDPTFFFRSLIETGNPDYVAKGYEGLQRFAELQRADALLRREAPELFGPAPSAAAPAVAAPAAAPTTAPGSMFPAPSATSTEAELQKGRIALTNKMAGLGYPVDQAAPPAAAAVTPNQLAAAMQPAAAPAADSSNRLVVAAQPGAAAPAEPANAMVQAGTPDARVRELRNKILTYRSVNDSRLKALADVYEAELKELTKPQTLSPGQQIFSGGRVVYTAPERVGANKPASLQELDAYMNMTPEQKAAFEKLQKIKQANVSASATAAGSPTGKSLSAPVGQRAEASLVKAEGAAGIMENANMVREALNTGNVIAGPLAGVRTKFAQVLEVAGAGDKQKLVNTRNTIQGLASLTLESRAELKGQGQITDTETKLLERARSADIGELTIPELQQVVNISQRLANRMWSNHQSLLRTMRTDPAAADSIRYYEPTMSLPQAIGEGKPQAEADKRTQGLDKIFKQPGR